MWTRRNLKTTLPLNPARKDWLLSVTNVCTWSGLKFAPASNAHVITISLEEAQRLEAKTATIRESVDKMIKEYLERRNGNSPQSSPVRDKVVDADQSSEPILSDFPPGPKPNRLDEHLPECFVAPSQAIAGSVSDRTVLSELLTPSSCAAGKNGTTSTSIAPWF